MSTLLFTLFMQLDELLRETRMNTTLEDLLKWLAEPDALQKIEAALAEADARKAMLEKLALALRQDKMPMPRFMRAELPRPKVVTTAEIGRDRALEHSTKKSKAEVNHRRLAQFIDQNGENGSSTISHIAKGLSLSEACIKKLAEHPWFEVQDGCVHLTTKACSEAFDE